MQEFVNEHDFYCLFTGPVTEVKTDIYVTSFGPVSDVEMVRSIIHYHNITTCNMHIVKNCLDCYKCGRVI